MTEKEKELVRQLHESTRDENGFDFDHTRQILRDLSTLRNKRLNRLKEEKSAKK